MKRLQFLRALGMALVAPKVLAIPQKPLDKANCEVGKFYGFRRNRIGIWLQSSNDGKTWKDISFINYDQFPSMPLSNTLNFSKKLYNPKGLQ